MIDILVIYGIIQLTTISSGFFIYKKNSRRHRRTEIHMKRLMEDISDINISIKRIEKMANENNENIWKLENASINEEPVTEVVKNEKVVKKTGTFSNITNRFYRKFI